MGRRPGHNPPLACRRSILAVEESPLPVKDFVPHLESGEFF